MNENQLSRRDLMTAAAAGSTALLAGSLATASPATAQQAGEDLFTYCLNTSTIRGHELTLLEELEVTAKAGYTAIEPWASKIQDYAESGGSLRDLRNKISDLGLTVESVIAFPRWIMDDEAQRTAGLENAKRQMDRLARIGAKRMAAPPAGAPGQSDLNLLKAAERYRALLLIGDETGVVPELELWGSSRSIYRLGQAAFILVEAGHPKACLLPDVYHIYRGGSSFEGLETFSGQAIQVFHFNDYPGTPAREKLRDSDRVFPGDGVAPLPKILDGLRAKREPVVLSLELFNRDYGKQDALTVAKQGLLKMKSVVEATLSRASAIR